MLVLPDLVCNGLCLCPVLQSVIQISMTTMTPWEESALWLIWLHSLRDWECKFKKEQDKENTWSQVCAVNIVNKLSIPLNTLVLASVIILFGGGWRAPTLKVKHITSCTSVWWNTQFSSVEVILIFAVPSSRYPYNYKKYRSTNKVRGAKNRKSPAGSTSLVYEAGLFLFLWHLHNYSS